MRHLIQYRQSGLLSLENLAFYKLSFSQGLMTKICNIHQTYYCCTLEVVCVLYPEALAQLLGGGWRPKQADSQAVY